MCAPFLSVPANLEKLDHAMQRCHSLLFVLSVYWPFSSFHETVVARDRTTNSFPLFAFRVTASLPMKPMSRTLLSYIVFLLFCPESLKAHSQRARGEAGSQVPKDAFLEGALQGGTKTQRALSEAESCRAAGRRLAFPSRCLREKEQERTQNGNRRSGSRLAVKRQPEMSRGSAPTGSSWMVI